MTFRILLHLQVNQLDVYRLSRGRRVLQHSFDNSPSGRAACLIQLNQFKTPEILVFVSHFHEQCLLEPWPQLHRHERNTLIARRCTHHFGDMGYLRQRKLRLSGKSTAKTLLLQGLRNQHIQELDWLALSTEAQLAVTTPALLLPKLIGHTAKTAPVQLFYRDDSKLHQLLIEQGETCFVRQSALPEGSIELQHHWIQQENNALADYLNRRPEGVGHPPPTLRDLGPGVEKTASIDVQCLDLIASNQEIPWLRTLQGFATFTTRRTHRYVQQGLLTAGVLLLTLSGFAALDMPEVPDGPEKHWAPSSSHEVQAKHLEGLDPPAISAFAAQIRALPPGQSPVKDLTALAKALEACPEITLKQLTWEDDTQRIRTHIDATLESTRPRSSAEACYQEFLTALGVDRDIRADVKKSPFDFERGALSSVADAFTSAPLTIELERTPNP